MQPTDINPALNAITSSLFRVSAKLLVIQDNKLLVVEENEGWFGLPGGGIDHGEPIIEALAREISEEIGAIADPSHISPLPIFIDSTAIFDGIPRITLLYVQASTASPMQPSHLELRFRWVTHDEFNSLKLAPNIIPLHDAIVKRLSE